MLMQIKLILKGHYLVIEAISVWTTDGNLPCTIVKISAYCLLSGNQSEVKKRYKAGQEDDPGSYFSYP